MGHLFSDPAKNVAGLELKLGSVVVDFGSGSGHYALAAARTVGDKGLVYAIDIQKDMLIRLRNDAQKQGFQNIEIVWGDIEKDRGSKLKDGIADAVIISNLMFQVGGKETVAKESFRILKASGKLMVIDWSDAFGGLGPHVDSVFTEKMAEELFMKIGFTLERKIDAGSHHYGLVFSKS